MYSFVDKGKETGLKHAQTCTFRPEVIKYLVATRGDLNHFITPGANRGFFSFIDRVSPFDGAQYNRIFGLFNNIYYGFTPNLTLIYNIP